MVKKKSKPWWGAAALLVLAALSVVASCTEILGIDTEYDTNPCATEANLPPVGCGVGACSVFTDACGADGLPVACTPGKANDVDTCGDGLDNDCDGSVDENDSGSCICTSGETKACYPGSPTTRNKGVCKDGTQKCQNGTWTTCEDAVLPSEDISDGLDNDCDGEIDEDVECEEGSQQYCYGGPEETAGKGSCKQGTQTCKDGKWQACGGQVLPSIEICDGFDNDCDGEQDDTNDPNSLCECNVATDPPKSCYVNPETGQAIPCPDNLKGACECGKQTCKDGKWGNCENAVLPAEKDVCDGQIDDDCDGVVDNVNPSDGPCKCLTGTVSECYTGAAGTAGVGTCIVGQTTCVNGQWAACQGQKVPTQEICDSLDNDCNGLEDDGVPGVGEVCYLAQFADTPCYQGTIKCELGDSTPKCKPNIQPGSVQEDCDGIDDNCDGIKDNGQFCCKGDGKQSGNETDLDCGGSCDTKCPDGKGCKVGNDCLSGNCVNDQCISPTCNDGVKNGGEADKDCGLVCGSNCVVGNSCNVDADCTSNLCEPANKKCIQKPTGVPCLSAVECASGNCVDGVCCNTACTEVCQACTAAKKGGGQDGACGPVADNTDLDNDCNPELSATCGLTGVCVGGACAKFSAGTICQMAMCTGPSTLNQADQCDGNGACLALLEQDCTPYACIGNACKASCLNDSECAAGYFCNTPQCQLKLPTGQPCTAGAQCQSGFCADGVCCNSDCDGTCKACNVTGSLGTCSNIVVGQDPQNECAAAQCDGAGQCQRQLGETCSNGFQCVSGNCVDGVCCNTTCLGSCVACNVAGNLGTCVNIPANTDPSNECPQGACSGLGSCQGVDIPCTQDNQCATGFCRDGFCCDTACSGTCEACSAAAKGVGANGVCGPIAAGSDPSNECNPGACAGNGNCQGANGAPCMQGNQCQSGYCIDNVCCNTDCNGTCQACNVPNSVGTCTSIGVGQDPLNECNPGACDGTGACQKADGQSCSSAAQCVSGFCVDGVCCNTACTGTCQACAAAVKGGGADGTCGPIAAGSDPQNDCQVANVSTCGNTGLCNGAGACELFPAGTACQTAQCIGPASKANQDSCNGSGLCQDGGTQDCTPFACNGGNCLASCVTDSQCAPGHFCEASDCKPKKTAGTMCVANVECQSGFCADGVCCNSACNDVCKTCALAGSAGTCVNVPAGQVDAPNCQGVQVCSGAGTCVDTDGQPCTSAGECFSSQCVDGVCCNTACSGVCNACTASKKGSGTDGQCGAIGNGLDPDGECAGAATCNGSGACNLLGQGSPCTTSAECGTGFCVDEVCCNTACTGQCQACSALKTGGANGTCTPIPSNTDPDNECMTECSGAGACESANGSSCTVDAGCQSGNCVDGVCCNNACNGTCQACNLAGSIGTCANVASGQDPANECAGAEVCSGSGTCVKPLGAACGGSAECLSGFCVDGVCCNNACNGDCKTCSLTGSVGTCSNVPAGEVDAPSCQGVQVCDGTGTCVDTNGQPCAVDAECFSGHCADNVCCDTACSSTCNACTAAKKGGGQTGVCGPIGSGLDPDNECLGLTACNGSGVCALLGPGVTCTAGAECQSGFCVDNVCCNTACGGSCQACSAGKTGGVNGTCAPVVANTDPDNECPAECSGAGACEAGVGSACVNGADCQSGNCVDGVCCNNACNGTCQACNLAGLVGTCSNIASGQDPASECPGADVCSGSGTCVKPLGAACAGPTDCQSGFCVDGVCCNSACTGTCQACEASLKTAGASGQCGPAKVGFDPHDDCAETAASTCGTTGVCNGSGQCAQHPSSTVCQPASCSNGVASPADSCNGSGTCVDSGTTPCGNYVCNAGGTACLSSCSSNADCASGAYCSGTMCVAKKAQGLACDGGSECQSGFCADGVCCASACGGVCQACSNAKTGQANGTCASVLINTDPDNECSGALECNGAGACLKAAGASCGAGTECQSGFCADGVCCDNACSGTCKSCNLVGSVGTCTNITAGADPSSECPGSEVCDGAGVCKKVSGDACMLANECLTASCADGVCCNNACSGTCEACDLGGSVGTCTPVPDAADPDDECPGLTTCDGAGMCELFVTGDACSLANGSECVSMFCVDGVCCGSACDGTCEACSNAKTGQTSGVCSSIPDEADPDSECVGATTCDGAGTCTVLSQGDPCTLGDGSECSTGFCIDGVCCNEACDGVCEACSNAKTGQTNGTCADVTDDTDPDSECIGATVCSMGACTQLAQGAACSSGAECASGFCVDGFCCNEACGDTCEACANAKTGQVNGTCANIPSLSDPDDDCTGNGGNDVCNGAGLCKEANGSACSNASECASGFCVDGFCCNQACNQLCRACSAAKSVGQNGVCSFVDNNTDPDGECPGGSNDCNGAGQCEN